LKEVFVAEGDEVVSGQLLGRIHNPDLEAHLAASKLDREALQVRLRALAAESSEEARLAVPVTRRQMNELEQQIAALESKFTTLELRSPQSGTLRTPRTTELKGRFFAAGQPVIEVGAGGTSRLLIALDELQARKLRPGQGVRVGGEPEARELSRQRLATFMGAVSAVQPAHKP
jgi:multidrug resistance efflux pump